jgi:integrase/recombinase XerD
MQTSEQLLDDFLQYKRACGYKYISESTILKSFGAWWKASTYATDALSKEILEEWAVPGVREGRKSLANRVGVLREFARYLNQRGIEAPMLKGIRNSRNKKFIPYVFSKEEMANILRTVDTLQAAPNSRYNAHVVYPVLFRMLYGCGLRISEALNLTIAQVDTEKGQLLIEVAKYDKPRIIPMSKSLTAVCAEYKSRYLAGKNSSSNFFQNKDETKRSREAAGRFFNKVLYKAGIAYSGRGKGPYIHNLRHTFACHAFEQMRTNGIDMYASLPLLSTYLGHESIEATERYLRLYQELFTKVATPSIDQPWKSHDG